MSSPESYSISQFRAEVAPAGWDAQVEETADGATVVSIFFEYGKGVAPPIYTDLEERLAPDFLDGEGFELPGFHYMIGEGGIALQYDLNVATHDTLRDLGQRLVALNQVQ